MWLKIWSTRLHSFASAFYSYCSWCGGHIKQTISLQCQFYCVRSLCVICVPSPGSFLLYHFAFTPSDMHPRRHLVWVGCLLRKQSFRTVTFSSSVWSIVILQVSAAQKVALPVKALHTHRFYSDHFWDAKHFVCDPEHQRLVIVLLCV